MFPLISKLQYKEFEPGEFVACQSRSYEDTITAIENFPWEREREHIYIHLTNPSVTIENGNGTYLKLALFYNNKYVLHFFDSGQTLYTKSFILLSDSYIYIKKFFAGGEFDTNDFKKENTWMQHNQKHFVTCDFRYEVTPDSAKKYLVNKNGFTFIMSTIIAAPLLALAIKTGSLGICIFALFTLLLVNMPGIILFLNYYRFAKSKILIMSRGNDTFYFGNSHNPIEFDKKNIKFITIIHLGRRYDEPGNRTLVIIRFNDGSTIHIPNIFINYIPLLSKLYNCEQKYKIAIPFIRNTKNLV